MLRTSSRDTPGCADSTDPPGMIDDNGGTRKDDSPGICTPIRSFILRNTTCTDYNYEANGLDIAATNTNDNAPTRI